MKSLGALVLTHDDRPFPSWAKSKIILLILFPLIVPFGAAFSARYGKRRVGVGTTDNRYCE